MAKLYTNVEGTLDIDLKVSEVITIVLNKDLEINYHFEDGDYKVLVFNDGYKELTLKEKGDLLLFIYSTYLRCNDKDNMFDLIIKECESKVNFSNKVVCLNQADFKMTIIGKIVNGAKNCKCHQKSNCLTFEDPKNCKVEPILLIDENDVEASHSLSCGTIDDDVLFYMNSRGLDKKASLSLLLLSYLMPSENFYEGFENGLVLKELAEKKVSDLCM